jgi:hypothetical protein
VSLRHPPRRERPASFKARGAKPRRATGGMAWFGAPYWLCGSLPTAPSNLGKNTDLRGCVCSVQDHRMGRNARPRRGAASSGPATAAAPPKKSITTKQRASKNTGQKTSAQAGRVSKNISKNISKKKGAPMILTGGAFYGATCRCSNRWIEMVAYRLC